MEIIISNYYKSYRCLAILKRRVNSEFCLTYDYMGIQTITPLPAPPHNPRLHSNIHLQLAESLN